MDYVLTCTHLENYQVQVTARTHSWIVDEPIPLDGDDLGPNPFELILGAVGACTVITLSHYGARAGVPIERMWVDVAGRWDDQKAFHIDLTVRVRGPLTDAHLDRVRADLERCQVHKLLEGKAQFHSEVVRV